MHLREKLNSIPNDKIVYELDLMLDDASVSISWYGERLVSVENYTETVDINEIVVLYLSASPRPSDGFSNLNKRLQFYNLWQKVKALCKDNKCLNDTLIYRYLVPIKDLLGQHVFFVPTQREYIVTHLKGTKFPSKNDWCFSFYEKDFKKLWPNEKPLRKICEEGGYIYTATWEMVMKALFTITRILSDL